MLFVYDNDFCVYQNLTKTASSEPVMYLTIVKQNTSEGAYFYLGVKFGFEGLLPSAIWSILFLRGDESFKKRAPFMVPKIIKKVFRLKLHEGKKFREKEEFLNRNFIWFSSDFFTEFWKIIVYLLYNHILFPGVSG